MATTSIQQGRQNKIRLEFSARGKFKKTKSGNNFKLRAECQTLYDGKRWRGGWMSVA